MLRRPPSIRRTLNLEPAPVIRYLLRRENLMPRLSLKACLSFVATPCDEAADEEWHPPRDDQRFRALNPKGFCVGWSWVGGYIAVAALRLRGPTPFDHRGVGPVSSARQRETLNPKP